MQASPTSPTPPAKPSETFQLRKGILGWVLHPQDREHHPLLYRLFHLTKADDQGNKDCLASEDLKAALPYNTLDEILEVVRSSAGQSNLRAVVCGNLRKCPTVRLTSVDEVETAAPRVVFSGSSDKAHRGVVDLYPEASEALRTAFEGKEPFTTGWFSSKHESQAANITRRTPGGRLEITAQVSMDDWTDLVPVLAAQVAADAHLDLGAVAGGRESFEESLADWAASTFALGEGNSYSTTISLAHNVSWDTMMARLQEQIDVCDRELEGIVSVVKEECAERLGIQTDDEAPAAEQSPRG